MLFRLSDIKRSYGGDEVLSGVSFQVNVGEKVGLVGRNGAGKTTIFRILTGAESPDSGAVVSVSGLKFGLLAQHVDFNAGETVHTAALSAFKEIHDIEAAMRTLEKQMECDHSEATLARYADLQIAFENADGYSYAARAEAVLQGLGFPKESWDQDSALLSGGQKNRLGLARLLLSSADVLLFDEPTNHLDVEAVEWLENFLAEYDGAYVVISHDRYFLDRTTSRIIEIDNGRAADYKGNYSKFIVEREIRREQQKREFDNQQAFINKTQEFIRRNLEGQKTKQAKSRRNMLERLERLDPVLNETAGGNFGLKKVERTGANVLRTENLSIGYDDASLASNIEISLLRGETLGIIGANGTGKTTLLKTLLGEIRELSGKILWGTKVDIGYYSQNLHDLNARNEVIQELRTVAPLADNGELRSYLARFLFFGDDVFKSVGDLSGGEKGRLSLAKLIYSRKNVLILDEPTNHLDIPAREALEDALAEYDGTIITVSHDRFFLDKIATQIVAFDGNGGVEINPGNYSDFHDWIAKKEINNRVISNQATPDTVYQQRNVRPDVQQSKISKNQRNQIEQRLNQIESEISDLETRAAALLEEMSMPDVSKDVVRIEALAAKHLVSETRLRELYLEWETASELLENNC